MNNFGILLKYEWKKLLHKKMVWITMAIILGIQTMENLSFLMTTYESAVVTGVVSEDGVGKSEVIQSGSISGYEYMADKRDKAKKLDGRMVDATLLKEMLESYANSSRERSLKSNPYMVIFHLAMDVYGDDYWKLRNSEEEAAAFYDYWQRTLNQGYLDRYLSRKEIEYWNEKSGEIEVPFTYRYAFSWKSILSYAQSTALLAALLSAVCLAGVFADEHHRKTDQTILCTENGKRPLYLAKILTGILFSLTGTLLLYAITACVSFGCFGTEGFDAILQINLAASPYPVSVGGAVLILLGLTILASILESVFILFLSDRYENGIAVMAILTGITLGTAMIEIPFQWRLASKLWGLFPMKLIDAGKFLDGGLINLFGVYFNSFQLAAFLYPLLTVLLFFLGKRKYERFQVEGR